MNTVGLVAFALVGATKAIREEFDMFGVTVVGLATAFAGGVTRDLLVNRIPLALSSPIEIGLGLLGVGLAIGVSAALESADSHPLTLFSDAIGLAAFTRMRSGSPRSPRLVRSLQRRPTSRPSASSRSRQSTRSEVVPLRTSYWIAHRLFCSATSTPVVRCWVAVRTGSSQLPATRREPLQRCVQRWSLGHELRHSSTDGRSRQHRSWD